MTWAIRCHDCAEHVWPPAPAEGAGGKSEIAALRLALTHATEAGHTDIEVVPGCYYIGEGERPEAFGDDVTVADCVTPDRGTLTEDLTHAVSTLQDEADRFEQWAEATDQPRQTAARVATRLRERATLLERNHRDRSEVQQS
jgi:hypothetical protein